MPPTTHPAPTATVPDCSSPGHCAPPAAARHPTPSPKPVDREGTMTETAYDSAVALVGMSGRFPGATDPDGLWRGLRAGAGGLRALTDKELTAAGVAPELLADPRYVRVGAPVEGLDLFDAAVFGFADH